ncbi:MAG: hypothetical protein CMH46_00615 [Muricauda sp.]|nr:hypothetical protein [Allomuricauda sp.]MAU14026.1 hypothetical protein [Allomuricauda sp.]
MSFLKLEEKSINKISTKNTAKPAEYENTESTLCLEPIARPVDTFSFNHNDNIKQKGICQQLKSEQPNLFQENVVIRKQVGNENQYKQMKQFGSDATVESLIDLMRSSNLVLRCNFIRPGFNARNSCMMCRPQDLEQMLKNPENEFKIKTVKLNLNNDDEFSPKHGTMFLSAVEDPQSGKHKLYSLDYHISEERDKTLYSIH